MKNVLLVLLVLVFGCSAQVFAPEPESDTDLGEDDVGQGRVTRPELILPVPCPEVRAEVWTWCETVESLSVAFDSCHPPTAGFVSCWPYVAEWGGLPGEQCCCHTGSCVTE